MSFVVERVQSERIFNFLFRREKYLQLDYSKSIIEILNLATLFHINIQYPVGSKSVLFYTLCLLV